MTATVRPTPTPGRTSSSTSLRIPSALLGFPPADVPDPLAGLITRGPLNRAYWPAAPSAGPFRSADGEVRIVRTPAATGATVGDARTGVPQSSPG